MQNTEIIDAKRARRRSFEALRGEYRAEHLFVLRQALELYDAYQKQIAECDREIAALLDQLKRNLPSVSLPLSETKPKRKKKRVKEFLPDVRDQLYSVTHGVDLTGIVGIADLTAIQIIAEVGTDMSPWPTAKHFASWTTLAPNSRITGGKRMRSYRPRSSSRIACILRLAAVSASRSTTAIGAFYRRMSMRIGSAKAVVATAAKLARTIYTMLKNHTSFADPGADF